MHDYNFHEETVHFDESNVISNASSLFYIREHNEKLCLKRIECDPWALKYVREQTFEVCLAAAKISDYTEILIKDRKIRYKVIREIERLKYKYIGIKDE